MHNPEHGHIGPTGFQPENELVSGNVRRLNDDVFDVCDICILSDIGRGLGTRTSVGSASSWPSSSGEPQVGRPRAYVHAT